MKNPFSKYFTQEPYTGGLLRNVLLYFPDVINLKAFALVEKIKKEQVNYRDCLLHSDLSDSQVEKACTTYGAILQT